MLKRPTILLIGFYMSLAFSAFRLNAQTADRPFTLGTLIPAQTVMPYKQYSGDSSMIRNLLFPPILNVGLDGRVRCTLCKDVPTVEVRKGESGTFVISMELKKDLKWGDGTAITAKDVKFTLEQMAKANYPAGEHPILPIRRIELDKEQSRKITLVLRHRRSDAFQLFAISLLPLHRAKDLEGLSARPLDSIKLISDPSFTYGTYRVESATDSSFQLVTNEKTEWEQKPDQPLLVRFYKTKDDLLAALKSSAVDQSDELSWQDYESMALSWPEMANVYGKAGKPSDTMDVLLLNLHSPLLVNPQLRQALFYAINREALNKIQFNGLATAGNGLLSDAFATRLDRARQPPYNLKQAAQILDQSGWIKGPDGLRTSEGQRFILNLSCPKERLDDRWLAVLSADLSKLGIKLEVDHPENADYMKKVVAERRFKDVACVNWTLPQLSIPNNLFHSLAIPNRENNHFGANYSAWDAHVVDKLLDNMLREIDLNHFVRQFGRLDKQFMSDLPGIPLVYEPKVILTLKSQSIKPSEELSRVLQTPTQIKL
ncbi:MAG: ABC transporter substrate-binding protein [Bdellovibrionota bacterium]